MFSSAILLCIALLLFFYIGSSKPKGFPPGPKWWPIVGSALEIVRLRKSTGYLYKTFTVLQEKYGPVIGLKIGSDRLVVLNDYKSIHSTLINEDCDGRPTGIFYRMRTWGTLRGILVIDGPLWSEQRRFVLRHLREFGYGRSTMASLVEDEAWHLIEHFKKRLRTSNNKFESTKKAAQANKNSGQIYQLAAQNVDEGMKIKTNVNSNCELNEGTNYNKMLNIADVYTKTEDYVRPPEPSEMIISMHDAFGVPVLNTLWGMMAGKRYNTDDEELKYLQRTLTKLLKDVDIIGCPFGHFPILRFIAPEMSGYKQFVHIHEELRVFLDKELQKHKNTFMPDQVRDLMDAYLKALQSEHVDNTFSETQLLAICLDMFVAGSETTSKALSFCFLYLVLYPNVQRKAQEEIDRVIGRDQFPTLQDRPRMTYIEAVVLESIRMFMGRTFNIPHRTLKDTYIMGYRIPKDTMVIVNFNRVLMDESWGDPEYFRPERFIDQHGKIVIPDQYLPFGFGKHRCMGETLARSNIFVIVAALLQTFTFSEVSEEERPSLEFMDGVTAGPKPFRVRISTRM